MSPPRSFLIIDYRRNRSLGGWYRTFRNTMYNPLA